MITQLYTPVIASILKTEAYFLHRLDFARTTYERPNAATTLRPHLQNVGKCFEIGWAIL